MLYRTRKITAALGVLGLAGCRAFDPALLAPTSDPLPVQLPPLVAEVRLPHFSVSRDSQAVATDVRTLFGREVREVLADSSGAPRGFAVLTARRVRYGTGPVYSYISGLAFGGLALLGLPMARYRCAVDVQLDVRNQRRELIGTYYAQGQAKATAGPYSHANYAQPERVLYVQCVRQGLAQIMTQLQPEIPHLREELAP
ncbi:hypothetical protein [Hymenobacter convexus]|uniref:hypothetical protein n=1 Tax=Hymenobacter sp. CA1UV-4 TaxID=3063782 RepID=UPI002713C506|nr:hypothetical protein [Hymenobacter sp. CA1UV-4]MDO7854468.1 hypothetical protein [Hymenobacter sp. CA1UV-4]